MTPSQEHHTTLPKRLRQAALDLDDLSMDYSDAATAKSACREAAVSIEALLDRVRALTSALREIVNECDAVGSPGNGAMEVARAALSTGDPPADTHKEHHTTLLPGTPLPWRASNWPLVIATDVRETVILEMTGSSSNRDAFADRNYIVECANAYPALLARVHALQEALRFPRNALIHDDPRWVAVPKEDFDKARAALFTETP